jgi:LysM repeat protein
MAEKGALFEDRPTACPFVALELDRDRRSDKPDYRHRCYAEPTPAPRAIAHQEAFCLSPNFPACPIFQDWATRAAARPVPVSQGYQGPTATSAAPVDEPAAAASLGEPAAAYAPPAGADVEPDASAMQLSAFAAAQPEREPPEPAQPDQSYFPSTPSAAPSVAPSPAAYDAGDWPGPPESADEPDAPQLPPFLAGRSSTRSDLGVMTPASEPVIPMASRVYDERIKREDVVPSWEIDGRYGAQSDGPRRPGAANQLVTWVAVAAILLVAVAAVIFLPRFLSGGAPGPTLRPSTSAGSIAPGASSTPLSSIIAVVPTPTLATALPTAVPTPAPTPTASPLIYKVKSGDFLGKIAHKFHVDVAAILAANPWITNPDHLEAGWLLVIPTTPQASPSP